MAVSRETVGGMPIAGVSKACEATDSSVPPKAPEAIGAKGTYHDGYATLNLNDLAPSRFAD